MRLVIQRISKGRVIITKTGEIVGQIERGLFVLVGVKEGDTEESAENLAKKLLKLRVMADTEEKMNLSVKDANAKVLVVSQFTLYADTSGGNRPSFIEAAKPPQAEKIYETFVEFVAKDIAVQTGKFGEYMTIEVVLDGPVTIVLEDES